ncbi:MAG TPA: DUF397 domain-containing protein [Pseudonocardiaceae bacterium]|nr:DUF397 domain-containing protein [Pseudonocardiaceae bacterium]
MRRIPRARLRPITQLRTPSPLATAPLPTWRKSTRSNNQGACVEVADLPGGHAVRDSKDPAGPALSFTAAQWAAFTTGLRVGEFG